MSWLTAILCSWLQASLWVLLLIGVSFGIVALDAAGACMTVSSVSTRSLAVRLAISYQ
jgi:hypothetical protein